MKAVIIAIMVMLSLQSCRPNMEERKWLTINGVVVSKFKDANSDCIGSIVLSTQGKLDTLHDVFICTSPNERVWDYVEPQDSIVKLKGTLIWKVVRSGKVKAFDYPGSYK